MVAINNRYVLIDSVLTVMAIQSSPFIKATPGPQKIGSYNQLVLISGQIFFYVAQLVPEKLALYSSNSYKRCRL